MPDYNPSEVMELLTTDNCIDVVWAVLEGDNVLEAALEMAAEQRAYRQEDEELAHRD